MKSIVIAERLKPFQHTPGSKIPLPGSPFFVSVYPTCISIFSFEESNGRELARISLSFKGPIQDFTVQLDLERECIHVWGYSIEGYFRYHLHFVPEKNKIGICLEKAPEIYENPFLLNSLFVELKTIPPARVFERLSLGNHKTQDWNLVKQRQNLAEILPAWFQLGQQMSSSSLLLSCGGTSDFLLRLEKCFQEKKCHEIYSTLLNCFNCAFSGILTPRLSDEDHLGFDLTAVTPSANPLILLTQGARLIRSLFLYLEGMEVRLLPLLPPEFHCGRLLGVQLHGIGTLDLEWSKKLIKRVSIYANQPCQPVFHFQKEIAECRVNKSRRYLPGTPLYLEAGSITYLDCFRK